MAPAFAKQETKDKTLKGEMSFRISLQKNPSSYHVSPFGERGLHWSSSQRAPETVRSRAAYPKLYGVSSEWSVVCYQSGSYLSHITTGINLSKSYGNQESNE